LDGHEYFAEGAWRPIADLDDGELLGRLDDAIISDRRDERAERNYPDGIEVTG
jgi:hypothetical protein